MYETNDRYDIENSFPMLIKTCMKMMRESLNRRFAEEGFDISSDQWIVLVHLWTQDGLTQQNLADLCLISKVSIFNILNKLEKKGLIIRTQDPVDGRSNRVYLTAEGKKIKTSLITLANKNIVHMTRGVSQDELLLVNTVLKKIIANLSKTGSSALS